VHIISINLPLIVVSIILFNSEPLNKCKPSFKNVSKEATNDTLILGMHFFLAQTFFMLLMQTNEIIITNLFSPDYVVEYSIYYKLFTAIGSLFMLALTPMWSKVTKDFTERKYQKIKKTHRLLSFVALLACALELLVVPFLQIIVNIWLQEDAIIIDDKVAILFAVYGGLYIFNVVLTTIANGIGEVRSQMVFYGIGAILKLPVIFMSRNIGLHWSAVVAYTSIILLLFCVYQFIWLNKKIEKLLA